MVNIAVCEDNSLDRCFLKRQLPRAARKIQMDYCIQWFDSGRTLLNEIREGTRYDLVILDILMEDINGIDTAQQIMSYMPQTMVSFITHSRDFAVDAYALNAIHYLLKPVEEDKLVELLMRYMERRDKAEPLIEITTNRESVFFSANSVEKIQSYRKGVAVYIRGRDEPKIIHSTFKSVEERLDKTIFVCVSRGLAVNMDYIDHISQGCCFFSDGTSALISRKNKAKVKMQYNQYLFDKISCIGGAKS